MKALLAAVFAALVLAPAAMASHPAGLYTKTDQVATMDDGVGIATTLYVPFEHAPHPGRFPAVMLFHGLGGNRQSIDQIATRFAQRGYIALTFDFRGHGESGGLFTALGARELLDVARLREAWLPANAPLDGDKVGGWGISLGGGALLRAAGEGTPFKALEVVETWTDLYEALVPQDLPKSGAIFQFLGAVPSSRQAPELLALQGAVARRDVPTLRAFAIARSSRQLLSRGYPPTLFFQGRRDFAFGLEQGIAGWQRHSGPKALYIGAFGHAPSSFPGPDIELVMQRALQWFDVHVSGAPAIPTRPAVELANESGTAVRGYAGLPPTARHVYSLRGNATIGSSGKVVRRARSARLLETFGAPTVQVRASSATGWSHLVAVLVARTPSGQEIVVSEGGVPTSLTARPKLFTIRLISQATRVPAGSRLELTLAGTSTAQNAGNLLYLVPVPQRARITVRNVTLTIPALRTPVSR
jgi:pimeloyl-ACP methyl ester carboxylesterase